MTAESAQRDEIVVATRPTPGDPRPYDFPSVQHQRLGNGLTTLVVDMPGRPLVSATASSPSAPATSRPTMAARQCWRRAP